MNQFFKTHEEFQKARDPNGSYLIFGVEKNADGETYMAQILLPEAIGSSNQIELRHETLDAYIFWLQSLKQELEILRMQHGKA